MKLPRSVPHFRSLKLAPLAIISVFLFTNLTGIFFSRAFAPSANANITQEIVPTDIPTSGNTDLDHVIFHAGERAGVDPRFIHAVIWQESKYNPDAHSRAGAVGLLSNMCAISLRVMGKLIIRFFHLSRLSWLFIWYRTATSVETKSVP